MGVSTDAQICFGILFPDGHEFPWEEEHELNEYGSANPKWGDVEEWWRDVNGYKPPFQLFTAEGEYIDGKEPPQEVLDAYFDPMHVWEKEHPMPVELVNYCSADYPIYILAAKGSLLEAGRGSTKEMGTTYCYDPALAKVVLDFCAQYKVEIPDGECPKWWLSSYWG